MTEARRTAKYGKVTSQPGQPLQFTDEVELQATDEHTSSPNRAIGLTIRAYYRAARELLTGKYASALALAPPHLRSPCDILVLCCPDGVVVRYDKAAQEPPKLRWSNWPESLTETAPKFSEHVIHFPHDVTTYVPVPGPGFTFCVTDPNGQAVEQARLHPVVYASLVLPPEFKMPTPPARPPLLVSMNRELQIQLVGRVLPANTPIKAVPPSVDHFVGHGIAALAVGWEAIEIYPPLGEEYWKPEYASIWAEQDLLGAIAQANAIESALHRLDGRAEARERHARAIEEFEGLLAGPEEPAHQFLKVHPELLCPTHDAVWSKLRFGERVSDFVFREPKDDYLLVEIEAPYRELFRRDGQQREELTHAINQTHDWIQHIQDNKTAIEQELGLVNISATPRTLVVIGRDANLSDENRKKLTVIQGQNPKLQILTYDDVISRARANLERLFGPLSLRAHGLKLYFYRDQ